MTPENWSGILVVEPPRAISDQIYEFLKKQIITSELEPGQRLMQNQVAETLKASRTPVRDAFRRLEQDGLVERLPQGGVRVTQVSPETMEEVFGIRQVLEAYAVELACGKITPEAIETLRRMRGQAKELLESNRLDMEAKLRRLFELNSSFHDTIYRATGSLYLMKFINDLKNIVLRMRALGLRAESTWFQAWEEHEQLIDHLENRDRKAAAKLMKRHIANAFDNVITALRQRPRESYQIA